MAPQRARSPVSEDTRPVRGENPEFLHTVTTTRRNFERQFSPVRRPCGCGSSSVSRVAAGLSSPPRQSSGSGVQIQIQIESLHTRLDEIGEMTSAGVIPAGPFLSICICIHASQATKSQAPTFITYVPPFVASHAAGCPHTTLSQRRRSASILLFRSSGDTASRDRAAAEAP